MPEARYLDPTRVRISQQRADSGIIVQIDEETPVQNATLKRLLPLSSPDVFVAVLNSDKTEVGILKSLDGMEGNSKKTLMEVLDRQYFTPKVTSITSLKAEGGMWHFVVETQRGPAEFYVRNWRDSAHEISPNRWLVHSVDGQRFDIPTVEDLDARSQALLDQVL